MTSYDLRFCPTCGQPVYEVQSEPERASRERTGVSPGRGFEVAREVAGWLQGQDREAALRKVAREEEIARAAHRA